MSKFTNQDSQSNPALMDGLKPFDTYSSFTHIFLYLLGIPLWILVYSGMSRIVVGDGVVIATYAAISAALVMGIYYCVLFIMGVGSPVGNILAPAGITLAMPGVVYRTLLPGGVVNQNSVVPILEGEVGMLAFAIGLGFPLLILPLYYFFHSKPSQWEKEVMPDGFSFIEYVLTTGSDTSIQNIASIHPKAGTVGLPLFFLLLFSLGFTLILVPDQYYINVGDFTGLYMVIFSIIFVLVARK